MWVDLMEEGKWFLPQCGSKFVLITECHVSVNLQSGTKVVDTLV